MPAKMIAMPVRGDQIVDVVEPGILNRVHDAVAVPDIRPAAAGIDQRRVARRRHEERRVAALHVRSHRYRMSFPPASAPAPPPRQKARNVRKNAIAARIEKSPSAAQKSAAQTCQSYEPPKTVSTTHFRCNFSPPLATSHSPLPSHPQSSQSSSFTLPNSLALDVTSVNLCRTACPAISTS